MKKIKTFEKFVYENMTLNWNNMTKKERIKFLVSTGMSSKEAHEIYSNKINELPNEIKDLFRKVKNNESVGEYEDSFLKIDLDDSELDIQEHSPNLGKLKQKSGKIIIETPSKTDAYNAKMRLGGDIIQEPGSDKQIHTVRDTK